MFKKAGLRSEIIVNITLLLGAAMLFAGFLLLKLTERELVTQRVRNISGAMEIVSRSLSSVIAHEGSAEKSVSHAADLLKGDPIGLSLEGWKIFDRSLTPLAGPGIFGDQQSTPADLGRVRYSKEPSVRTTYPSAWLPFAEKPESFAVVTVPFSNRGEFVGALRARFGLNEIRQRVLVAYKLIFLYGAIYGAVLVVFGIYLLNRTVVHPVQNLRQGTQYVAAGELDYLLPEEGPREIADLAASFNTMTTALKASRERTKATIVSLREANEDIKRTRNELIRSEKMASVGHLAAGMAHEIGNPLGAVVGYLELLKSELPSGKEREILERSLAEAQRIDRLVRDLLDYASPASVQPEMLDPVRVLSEARDLLLHQGALAGLNIVDGLPSSLPAVVIARHKLLQVFVNLILNARDASSEGGAIRLDGGAKGEDVWLAVADEGSGISPEVQSHIFDPFYTTKAPNKGKGLGLSVSYRAIDEAGGRIEVISAEGEGSTFTVWLKRVETEHDEA